MIYLTRLNDEQIVVNAALIEFIEATPDTIISLATGRKLMVRENVAEVLERVIAYQQRIGHPTVIPYSGEHEDEDAT